MLLGLLAVSRPLPSLAQDSSKTEGQIFTDWRVACDADAPCRMAQTVVQPSSGRLIIQMKVFSGEVPTALLSFPLGILLSTGWQYQIDGGQKVTLPFEICNTEGCHAGIRLTSATLASLKRGNEFRITFYDASQSAVQPVISLAGFTKAWNALQ